MSLTGVAGAAGAQAASSREAVMSDSRITDNKRFVFMILYFLSIFDG
jgi:hypothetical protein